MVDPSAGVQKVANEGRCRVCGVPGRLAPIGILNRAHLVSRSRGGDDLDDNLVPLCGSGNTGCHGAFDFQSPMTTSPSLWRVSAEEVSRVLWSRLTPEERFYVITKENLAWAERRFRLT